jgi:hypothetical protein
MSAPPSAQNARAPQAKSHPNSSLATLAAWRSKPLNLLQSQNHFSVIHRSTPSNPKDQGELYNLSVTSNEDRPVDPVDGSGAAAGPGGLPAGPGPQGARGLGRRAGTGWLRRLVAPPARASAGEHSKLAEEIGFSYRMSISQLAEILTF